MNRQLLDIFSRRVTRCAKRVSFGLYLGSAAIPAFAHHSFTQFDGNKSYLLEGTITSFEWTNPHGWIWIAVPDGKGGIDVWGAETKAPSGLVRDGWTKRSFNPGDKVTLYIHPMRGATKTGEFVKAVLADGRVLEPVGGTPNGPVRDPQPPPGPTP